MRLTNDLIDKLLNTRTELQFVNIIFSNRIEINEWQNCETVFAHYKKLHEEMEKTAVRLSDPIITEAVKRKK